MESGSIYGKHNYTQGNQRQYKSNKITSSVFREMPHLLTFTALEGNRNFV